MRTTTDRLRADDDGLRHLPFEPFAASYNDSDTGTFKAPINQAGPSWFGRAIEAERARQAQPGSRRSPRARLGTTERPILGAVVGYDRLGDR